MRSRLSRTSFKGSLATSPALISRCSPLATSVTSAVARRAVRSAFRAWRMSSFTSAYLLHIDTDGATAGQANIPGRFIGDAEFEHFRLAALDHIHCFGHHGPLNAAARYRSEKVAFIVDDQVRANRPRGRPPCLNHRSERNLPPVFAPFLGGLENVFIAGKHRSPPSRNPLQQVFRIVAFCRRTG